MSQPLPAPVTAGLPAVVAAQPSAEEACRQHLGHVLDSLSTYDPHDYDTLEEAMFAVGHLVQWAEGVHALAPAGTAVEAQLQRFVWSARNTAAHLKRAEAAMISRDERGD